MHQTVQNKPAKHLGFLIHAPGCKCVTGSRSGNPKKSHDSKYQCVF